MNVPATARTGRAARALAVDALVAARARVAARDSERSLRHAEAAARRLRDRDGDPPQRSAGAAGSRAAFVAWGRARGQALR